MKLLSFHNSVVFEIWLKLLLNLLTSIYGKLKYTIVPVLLKPVCQVFKYTYIHLQRWSCCKWESTCYVL